MSAPHPQGFPVFVAAPYARAREVLCVHEELLAIGCFPTSHWARLARGTLEELRGGDAALIQSAIELNDACLRKSSAVLALSCEGEGGEMFCEVARALERYVPVVWVGTRLILSTFRMGVYTCEALHDALAALSIAAEHVRHAGSVGAARQRLHRFFRARSELRAS
jgi:hypothetical protein